LLTQIDPTAKQNFSIEVELEIEKVCRFKNEVLNDRRKHCKTIAKVLDIIIAGFALIKVRRVTN